MSALEQALRRIDDQRQNAPKAQGAPTMMALTTEPLLVHTLLRWLPSVLLLMVVVTAAGTGYWMHRSGGVQPAPGTRSEHEAMGTQVLSGPQRLMSSSDPVGTHPPATGLPALSIDAESSPKGEPLSMLANELLFKQPEDFEQATAAWRSGQHAQAAQLWLNGLRRLPPSTMALLLAEHQVPAQVDKTVLARAAALDWLVIPGTSNAGTGWTVLVLPPPGDLDRSHAALARSGEAAPQWGTVAHWVARSEALVPSMSLTASGTQQPASGGRAMPTSPMNTVQLQPTTPRPPASTPTDTTAPMLLAKTPTQAVAPPASGAAASAPPAPAAPVPVAPRSEPPQLSRSPATDISAIANSSVPSAARAIENELASIEQELSAARYDVALKRLSKLEENIGANWRTRYLTGVALSGLQRWREAVPMLTLARQGNTEHARVALYLSVAQQELGQHEAAIETLTQALVPHAGMPELWLNKAHSLQALGRGEEAAFHYRRFLDLSTNRQDLSQQRSWVQKLLDQKDSTW